MIPRAVKCLLGGLRGKNLLSTKRLRNGGSRWCGVSGLQVVDELDIVSALMRVVD